MHACAIVLLCLACIYHHTYKHINIAFIHSMQIASAQTTSGQLSFSDTDLSECGIDTVREFPEGPGPGTWHIFFQVRLHTFPVININMFCVFWLSRGLDAIRLFSEASLVCLCCSPCSWQHFAQMSCQHSTFVCAPLCSGDRQAGNHSWAYTT